MAETTWEARGVVLAACNCDYGCPCNFNGRPTDGYCEGGWSWHVEEGSFGGVPLDDLNLSLFATWPGAIHDGGGQAITFYDERAGDEQREALVSLLAGEAGGPWGVFSGTYSFVRPHAPARYRLELAGERSSLRIGEAVVLETEPITNPVTGAEVHPRIELPEGLVVKELDVLRSRAYSVRDGISYEHPDRYVLLGPFAYTGP